MYQDLVAQVDFFEPVMLFIGHKEAFDLSRVRFVPQGQVYLFRSTVCGLDNPYVVNRSL